jgi:hypothetical protein
VSSAAASANPSVRVLGDAIPGERVRDVLLTVGYALAIAASAQLYFFLPGNPVPITAQTFVVLAGAIVLGTSRATVGAWATSRSVWPACRGSRPPTARPWATSSGSWSPACCSAPSPSAATCAGRCRSPRRWWSATS